MIKRPRYTAKFYEGFHAPARESAEEVVPILLDLTRPNSVVDVGCGAGEWLAVVKEHGVKDILGIDGSIIPSHLLQIPPSTFLVRDLSGPLQVGRHFDLVLTLEVAEHLSDRSARSFVGSLADLGHMIAFSAAIPKQGGTHHINEQWPDYWAKIFHEYGFVLIDCIRRRVWQNDRVAWWYSQNMLLFVRPSELDLHPSLKGEWENSDSAMLAVVHPNAFLTRTDVRNMSLKNVLSLLPYLARKALAARLASLSAR